MSKRPTGASRGVSQTSRARASTTDRSIRDRGAPSITSEIVAANPRGPAIKIEGALKADVDEALALHRAGGVAPCTLVARLIKQRHNLPNKVDAIRIALLRYAGGAWR